MARLEGNTLVSRLSSQMTAVLENAMRELVDLLQEVKIVTRQSELRGNESS